MQICTFQIFDFISSVICYLCHIEYFSVSEFMIVILFYRKLMTHNRATSVQITNCNFLCAHTFFFMIWHRYAGSISLLCTFGGFVSEIDDHFYMSSNHFLSALGWNIYIYTYSMTTSIMHLYFSYRFPHYCFSVCYGLTFQVSLFMRLNQSSPFPVPHKLLFAIQQQQWLHSRFTCTTLHRDLHAPRIT